MAYESPTYRVEELIDEIELRRYEPYLVAETLVPGPLERAGNGGFRLLAGYIFSGNKTADGDSTKIATTTPVAQDRVGDQFRVRFMMPTRHTDESLPTPKDLRFTISEVGPQRLAGYKLPRSVVVRGADDPLPKSGAGKILKRDLREPYWEGKDRQVG